ncbi:hypothetical protein BDW66DRAFT_3552 [Aspergillus desertorum]
MLCSLLGPIVHGSLHAYFRFILTSCPLLVLMIFLDRRTMKTSKMKEIRNRSPWHVMVSVLLRFNTLQCLLWEAIVIEERRLRDIHRVGWVILKKRRRKMSLFFRRHLVWRLCDFFLI